MVVFLSHTFQFIIFSSWTFQLEAMSTHFSSWNFQLEAMSTHFSSWNFQLEAMPTHFSSWNFQLEAMPTELKGEFSSFPHFGFCLISGKFHSWCFQNFTKVIGKKDISLKNNQRR